MAGEGADELMASPGASDCHYLAFQNKNTTGSKKTDLTAPREIAFYSFDDEHKYRPDDSSLSYYWPMKVDEHARRVGLQTGLDTFKQVDESIDRHLDALLQALQEKEAQTGRITDAEVITWRGQLTKILTAIYSKRDSFEMNVTKFQGQIFLEEHHQARLERDSKPFANQSAMAYLGYKFETLSTIPDVWDNVRREEIENRHAQQVSNHSQYCSIVSTTLDDKHKLVYGGEVDCIWDSHDMLHSDPREYHGEYGNNPNYTYHNWVELKTLAKSLVDKRNHAYEMRLFKFWAQSYLINCPRIILGLRTDYRGILDIPRVETLKTHAIPHGKFWSKSHALEFLSAFIQLLKDHVTEGDYWRVRHVADQDVLQLFLVKRGTYGSIISEQFLQWRHNFDEDGILKSSGAKTGEEQASEAMEDVQPSVLDKSQD
ncbi:putative Dhp1-interacting protein Din1 [Phyllosticta capitalensis]